MGRVGAEAGTWSKQNALVEAVPQESHQPTIVEVFGDIDPQELAAFGRIDSEALGCRGSSREVLRFDLCHPGGAAAVERAAAEIGEQRFFTVTFPVRAEAFFDVGSGIDPTLTVDGIVYTLRGDDDLQAPSTLAIDEIVPALSSGMPPVGGNYGYRTFRLTAGLDVTPKGFISIEIDEAPNP